MDCGSRPDEALRAGSVTRPRLFKGDLSNFAGTSYGAKLDVGVVEKGDFKVSSVFTKAFAALCGGLGGGPVRLAHPRLPSPRA